MSPAGQTALSGQGAGAGSWQGASGTAVRHSWGVSGAGFRPWAAPGPDASTRMPYRVNSPRNAGVVQWQNGSFPSFIQGFDSPHPLQHSRRRRFTEPGLLHGPSWPFMALWPPSPAKPSAPPPAWPPVNLSRSVRYLAASPLAGHSWRPIAGQRRWCSGASAPGMAGSGQHALQSLAQDGQGRHGFFQCRVVAAHSGLVGQPNQGQIQRFSHLAWQAAACFF